MTIEADVETNTVGPWRPVPDALATIRATYDPPPIPVRQFDWRAVEDDYDLGRPVGFGRTEAEAIKDLREQLEAEDG